MALADSPLGTLGEFFVANSATGYLESPNGNLHPEDSPHGAFRCSGRDNWIAISITTNCQWEALKAEINDKRLDHPDYNSFEDRKAHEKTLNLLIENWTSNKVATELMERLQKQKIPAGRVATNLDVLNDSHLNERDYFSYLQPTENKLEKYDGQAIPGNQKARENWFPMRDLGEDSAEILMNYLGYSKQSYQNLLDEELIS